MRWIFIILLIVNVVYFGWELDRETRLHYSSRSEVLPVPAGVKRLRLVDEIPAPEPGESPDGPDSAETATARGTDTRQTDVMIEQAVVDELLVVMPPIRTLDKGIPGRRPASLCFSYGPFPDQSQAVALMTWFQDRDIEVSQRFEQDRENPMFWIYLAPQESRDSAIKALENLKKKGVKDYRLIETGTLQNAISLGLFTTQASVNRRLNELKDKGYQPVVVPYRDADAIYWIEVRLNSDSPVLNQMFSGFPARFNSVPVKCSEIALP